MTTTLTQQFESRVDDCLSRNKLVVSDRDAFLTAIGACYGFDCPTDESLLRRAVQFGAVPVQTEVDPLFNTSREKAFRQWLRQLEPGFDALPAVKRLQLWNDWRGEIGRTSNTPSPVKFAHTRTVRATNDALRAIVNPTERMQAAAALDSVEKLEKTGRDFDRIEANRLRQRYPSVFAQV